MQRFNQLGGFCQYLKIQASKNLVKSQQRSVIQRNLKHQDIDLKKELTFKNFKLMPEIVSVLDGQMQIRSPTPIQQLAIPHLLNGKSALLAAQTGTGKSLTYSLPLIHRLKQAEVQAGTQLTIPNKPRSVVLVPSRELV